LIIGIAQLYQEQTNKQEEPQTNKEREEQTNEQEEPQTNKEMLIKIMRCGDTSNFIASSKYNIWGVNSKKNKDVFNGLKEGDILVFVQNNLSKKTPQDGNIIAIATYKAKNSRVMTNEQLGWTGDGNWDYELHYTDLYDLREDKINIDLTQPYGGGMQASYRLYNASVHQVEKNGEETNLYELIKDLFASRWRSPVSYIE
jgi:hypothetical protein